MDHKYSTVETSGNGKSALHIMERHGGEDNFFFCPSIIWALTSDSWYINILP